MQGGWWLAIGQQIKTGDWLNDPTNKGKQFVARFAPDSEWWLESWVVPEQALVDEQGLNKSCSGKGHLLVFPIMSWEMFLSGGSLKN